MLEEMIRALRRRRLASLLASLGLVTAMALTVSSPLHEGGDDSLCGPAGGTGAFGAALLTADAPPGHAQHCVLCHAVQSLRAETASSRFGPPIAATGLVRGGALASPPAAVASATPARAPPLA